MWENRTTGLPPKVYLARKGWMEREGWGFEGGDIMKKLKRRRWEICEGDFPRQRIIILGMESFRRVTMMGNRGAEAAGSKM